MPRLEDLSVGKVGFVERHELWTDEQQEAAERSAPDRGAGAAPGPDLLGRPARHRSAARRSPTPDFLVALRNGQDFQTRDAASWTRPTTSFDAPVRLEGGASGSTGALRLPGHHPGPGPDDLPGAAVDARAPVGCSADMYFAERPRRCPFCTRQILRRCSTALRERGLRRTSPGSRSSATSPSSRTRCSRRSSPAGPRTPAGGEHRRARLPVPDREPQRRDRRHSRLLAGQPDRARPAAADDGGRVGPGPVRVHLRPAARAWTRPTRCCCSARATKQICRRNGYHATFMTRPALPELLLQRLAPAPVAASTRDGGGNAFTNRADDGAAALRARPATSSAGCSSTPPRARCSPPRRSTATSASRRSRSRPDRAYLGGGEPGAMIRVIGGPGDETAPRREPRGRAVREPVPVHGLPDRVPGSTGSTAQLDPGPPTRSRTRPTAGSSRRASTEAVAAAQAEGDVFRERFGDPFVDYIWRSSGTRSAASWRTSPTGSTASTSRSSRRASPTQDGGEGEGRVARPPSSAA